MLSIIRSCLVNQRKTIAVLGGISAASLTTMAAAQGVDFHKINTDTKLKTLPAGTVLDARDIWSAGGAVIQIVRRPG